jgi:hypothetical protein
MVTVAGRVGNAVSFNDVGLARLDGGKFCENYLKRDFGQRRAKACRPYAHIMAFLDSIHSAMFPSLWISQKHYRGNNRS